MLASQAASTIAVPTDEVVVQYCDMQQHGAGDGETLTIRRSQQRRLKSSCGSIRCGEIAVAVLGRGSGGVG